MHYYYFNLNGGVISMKEDTAKVLMERITPEWKKKNTQWGTLYYGEYDWYGEVVEGEYQTFPPRLKNGTSVPKNNVAERFFGERIIGECFLLPREEKRHEVQSFVMQPHVRFKTAS